MEGKKAKKMNNMVCELPARINVCNNGIRYMSPISLEDEAAVHRKEEAAKKASRKLESKINKVEKMLKEDNYGIHK